jgi:hypothetical protein
MRARSSEHTRAPILVTAWRRNAARLAAVCVALAGFAVSPPGAVGAAASAPAPVSFDSELLGSWAAVGNALNVNPGVWTGNPSSIAAQWYRCAGSGANFALTRSITRTVAYSFQAILDRSGLAKRAKYDVHLTATNANGKTKTLTINFTA